MITRDSGISYPQGCQKSPEISHYLFITGTGGLGKSMMMRHLMLNAIDNYNEFGFIPIFIPLKEFDETAGNLLGYVLQKIFDFKCDITQSVLEDALSAGRCLLLFDGLDEIALGSIDRFEHEINSFTDEYPLNQFVISSRPFQAFVSYQKFSILRILPFDLRQALQLIDNLDFCPDDPSIKEKFRKELSTKLYRSHRAFTENPLLLTIMLMTFEMYAEVPSQMYLFYREAFNVLSRNHDASKGYNRELKTKLSVDAFGDIFSEICFRTYKDGKFEFSKPEFDIYFNMLQNPEVKSITATDFMQDTCYSILKSRGKFNLRA